jgi:Tol biopolymer transport system component
VVNADGTGLRQLTHLSGEDGWPAWSPDGGTIAFDHQVSSTENSFAFAIYLVGADGSSPHPFTPVDGHLSYDYPDWSRDGSLILFSGYPPEGSPGGGMFLMRSDGSAITRIQPDGVSPVWKP